MRFDTVEFQELRPSEPIRIRNVTCPYCGGDVSGCGSRTKEHVIARRLVPKGVLDRQWNVIVWACQSCNRIKRDLEDDIGAITIQPDVRGRYAVDDPLLRQESIRKGKGSFSRRTKKHVKDSRESFAHSMQLAPGFTLKGNYVCGPQVTVSERGDWHDCS